MEGYFKIFTALALLGVVAAYSGGAPAEVCHDMIPKHPVDPQTSPLPYNVKVSKGSIRGGDTVEITISGKEGKTFKGLMAQVRSGSTTIGHFEVDPRDKFIKTLDCPSGTKNAITHKNSENKRQVVLRWVAPQSHKGVADVYVTVAENGGVFWAGVKAGKITIQ